MRAGAEAGNVAARNPDTSPTVRGGVTTTPVPVQPWRKNNSFISRIHRAWLARLGASAARGLGSRDREARLRGEGLPTPPG